jgi:hypothetical protein
MMGVAVRHVGTGKRPRRDRILTASLPLRQPQRYWNMRGCSVFPLIQRVQRFPFWVFAMDIHPVLIRPQYRSRRVTSRSQDRHIQIRTWCFPKHPYFHMLKRTRMSSLTNTSVQGVSPKLCRRDNRYASISMFCCLSQTSWC